MKDIRVETVVDAVTELAQANRDPAGYGRVVSTSTPDFSLHICQ